jgi:hypothetical protein
VNHALIAFVTWIMLPVLLAGCAPLSGDSTRPDQASALAAGTDTGRENTSRTDGAAAARRSIRSWVSCNGTSDDAAGVARAFEAAKNAAFTLVVDCPVLIRIGMDISRTIFIDNATTVEFAGAGKFTIDNVLIPAFVMANSRNIRLTNWNVEYIAGLPMNPKVGGYGNNGKFVAGAPPGNAFNDLRITQWLTANRAIKFDRSQGNVNSRWSTPTNTCAVFFIIGDTSDVRVTGLQVYVPATAGVDRFIPVVFSLSSNYKSNQTVTVNTPITGQYVAIPHDLTFSDITFDGTYMGWVGAIHDVVFENIKSHRYGDLEDANGENGGGVGKWFAPPHLFYLNYAANSDSALVNANFQINNVVDDGPRVGTARDKGGTDTISGYALSLKIGCVHCSVDNYRSSRPDGFLDVLPSDGLTISNVTATYDSGFLNNLFPGWRFPSAAYKNITFNNVTLRDSAASTIQAPIGPTNDPSNENIAFKNVRVEINRWSGQGLPVTNILGHRNEVAVDYSVDADASRIKHSKKGTVAVTLRATPSTLNVGSAASLTWTSKGAINCSANGAWSGAIGTEGSRIVKLTSAGNYDFTIECRNADDSSTATLRVVVSPNS